MIHEKLTRNADVDSSNPHQAPCCKGTPDSHCWPIGMGIEQEKQPEHAPWEELIPRALESDLSLRGAVAYAYLLGIEQGQRMANKLKRY